MIRIAVWSIADKDDAVVMVTGDKRILLSETVLLEERLRFCFRKDGLGSDGANIAPVDDHRFAPRFEDALDLETEIIRFLDLKKDVGRYDAIGDGFTELGASDLLGIAPDDLDGADALIGSNRAQALEKVLLDIDGIYTAGRTDSLGGFYAVEARSCAKVDDFHAFDETKSRDV